VPSQRSANERLVLLVEKLEVGLAGQLGPVAPPTYVRGHARNECPRLRDGELISRSPWDF
jgi:hypothetical protein